MSAESTRFIHVIYIASTPQKVFEAITRQGARLPSQRRFAARERSLREGVAVPRALYDEILAMTG